MSGTMRGSGKPEIGYSQNGVPIPAEAPCDRLPRVALSGVAESSPLMCLLTARLAGLAQLRVRGGTVAPSADWRRAVADTGLQWFDDVDRLEPREEVEDGLLVDLHAGGSGGSGRIWRVVGSTGRGVLSPFFGLAECWRPSGNVPLSLIETTDGGTGWVMLAEVRLSALQDYPVLLEGLASAVANLIATALGGNLAPSPWRPRARGRPTAWARLGYHAAAHARRLRNYATCELWAIGVLDIRPDALLAGEKPRVSRWIEIPQSEGYVADPIPWPGRSDLILCERFSHGTGRGSLQALTVQDGRIIDRLDVALPVDCHLSYPFVWMDEGRILCLPEMGASRRQLIYELSQDAPPRPVCTVADNVVMADPTLFRSEGLYWIAYTDGDIGLYDNLCLLWAERLEGPWHPHRANPVKIDVRSSRGAGALFRSGERLIRPAQDCSRTYGGSVVLNRVLECTTTAYREERVATVLPDPAGRFPDGLHTFSVCGDFVLIDGKRYVVDAGVLRQRVRSRLHRYLQRLPSRRLQARVESDRRPSPDPVPDRVPSGAVRQATPGHRTGSPL